MSTTKNTRWTDAELKFFESFRAARERIRLEAERQAERDQQRPLPPGMVSLYTLETLRGALSAPAAPDEIELLEGDE